MKTYDDTDVTINYRMKEQVQNNLKNGKNGKGKKNKGINKLLDTVYGKYNRNKHSGHVFGFDMTNIIKLLPLNNKFFILIIMSL